MGGNAAIGDRDLGAGNGGAVKCGLQVYRVRMAGAFAGGVAADDLTGDDARENVVLLFVGTGQFHRFGEVIGRGREGDRRQDAAHLFGQHAHFQHAEAEPALFFGNGCAEPAHLHDLLPERFAIVLGIVVQHVAHHRNGALGFEEFPCLAGKEFLVFGEIEVHELRASLRPFRGRDCYV